MEQTDDVRLITTMAARLSALAQPTRLRVFRLLVKAGDEGVRAKDIAEAVDVPPNTLSTHLRILTDAGLVGVRPQVRERYFSVRYDAMQSLLSYLVEDCCQGRAEVCAPFGDLVAKATCREPIGDIHEAPSRSRRR
jgi:DNA-binding transcriptional ArsR family regulator